MRHPPDPPSQPAPPGSAPSSVNDPARGRRRPRGADRQGRARPPASSHICRDVRYYSERSHGGSEALGTPGQARKATRPRREGPQTACELQTPTKFEPAAGPEGAVSGVVVAALLEPSGGILFSRPSSSSRLSLRCATATDRVRRWRRTECLRLERRRCHPPRVFPLVARGVVASHRRALTRSTATGIRGSWAGIVESTTRAITYSASSSETAGSSDPAGVVRCRAPPTVKVSEPRTSVTDYADFTGRTMAVEAVKLRARVWGHLEINSPRADVRRTTSFVIDQRSYKPRTRADAEVRKARLASRDCSAIRNGQGAGVFQCDQPRDFDKCRSVPRRRRWWKREGQPRAQAQSRFHRIRRHQGNQPAMVTVGNMSIGRTGAPSSPPSCPPTPCTPTSTR